MTENEETTPARLIAEHAEERGQGICRTCLQPIWNEGGTVGHVKRETGWSDRIERGGDSLVCFKAVEYRHVPLTGREAHIYDRALARTPGDRAEAAEKILLSGLGKPWNRVVDEAVRALRGTER